MRWLIWLAALLLPVSVTAQVSPEPPDELVLNADAPVKVWINGLEVALAVSTGTIDHVTLNDNVVRRLGLSAVPPDRKGDLVIGGLVALQGRHGRGLLAHDRRLQQQQLYWFPGLSTLPLAGTIGPFALPHERLRIVWSAAATAPAALSLPLVGNVDRAAYGMSKVVDRLLLVGVDVRIRRPLPLVTAATGADLAELLGGQLVGEPWQEEVLLGVRRPVRRLELNRPLQIGPILIRAVAVRQGGPRDGTARLAPGQVAPFDAEEDPEIMQVRGRTVKRRGVARYIMLSRSQLEAAGCVSLSIDRLQQRFNLACGAPAMATPAEQSTAPVPVALLSDTLIQPVLPPVAGLHLSLAEPVAVTIDNRPRQLMLGDGGNAGLLLNAIAATPLVDREVQQLRDRMAERSRSLIAQLGSGEAPPLDVVRGQNMPEIMAPQAAAPLPAEVTLRIGDHQTMMVGKWLADQKRLPKDGTVALAALPAARLRVQLSARALPAPAVRAHLPDLRLPIADRSHDQSVMGVAAMPGIDAVFVGLEPGQRQPEPVVSMALGDDLERLNGGLYEGSTWRQPRADGRQRRLRRMRLARPIELGPFRFDSVAVEQVESAPRFLRNIGWGRDQPWPDLPGVDGLERELRLSMTQLEAQGCRELEIDKPARSWALSCDGGGG